jgi:hypothetical protein
MARKRFSRLNYALTTLRTPTGTGITPDAPTGTIAKKYQDFKAGKVALSYPRNEDSKPEQLLQVSVLPFFFGGADGTEAIVKMSKRADDNETLSGVQSACNQIAVNLDTHAKLANFRPAKATVFDFGSTETTETSQITGVQYKKKTGKSYTFPYGASATEKAEGKVRKDIAVAVKALTTASVSFSSEKY